MAEWLKILITALASFTVAILAEPLKGALADWRARRTMTRQLYNSLAQNYAVIVRGSRAFAKAKDSADIDNAFSNTQGAIRLELFDEAVAEQKVFHDIPGSGHVRAIFYSLRSMKEEKDHKAFERMVSEFADVVTDRFKYGNVAKELVLKHASGYDQQLIRHALIEET